MKSSPPAEVFVLKRQYTDPSYHPPPVLRDYSPPVDTCLSETLRGKGGPPPSNTESQGPLLTQAQTSSPRLSDASCSETTASDRLSSEEVAQTSRKGIGPVNTQRSNGHDQPLVLQGRVIPGAFSYTSSAGDASNRRDSFERVSSLPFTATNHNHEQMKKDTAQIEIMSGIQPKASITISNSTHQQQQYVVPSYSSTKHQNKNISKEKKSKGPSIRAFPPSLKNRKILTKMQGAINPAIMHKYRCSAGLGIQVPVNRVETSPVKLSNWRVSWQELLCYNPRPYDVTKGFLENYTVIRGMMETFIHGLTDIVFEDRCTAAHSEPHVYHAYLLPPVCPHDWLTATCIQCYTSEDVWLARGAWKRSSVSSRSGSTKAETMHPANAKVLPFLPAFTKEEQAEQQRQYRAATMKTIPCSKGSAAVCRLYDSASSKLPLHLWIFLGGKDMQALDGLVIAWKLLRWASEIPPSEFVEGSEDLGVRAVDKQTTNETDAESEGRPSGIEVYRLYHQQRRCPTQDQTAQAAAWACGEIPSESEAESNNFSAFGPFLYDMSGVSDNNRYRTAFLMVDIPGYGNSTGHPSPCTIRSAVFQAVKHGIQELIEQHNEESIVLNILGYSLGCAVACSLAADLATTFSRDCMHATPSQAGNHGSWSNIATVEPALARTMNVEASASRSSKDASFDEEMLSFRDAFNVAMYNKNGVEHVCKVHGWTPSAGYSGIRLSVNRLILLAPFTSTQAMASKVAASAMGGGSFLSRAVSGLVSTQISWNNKEQLGNLLQSVKYLEENTPVSSFHNFRIKILHGDKDNVIPWSMGFELFNTLAALKKQMDLKIPINFQRLSGETHASILCGGSERYLLESCFSPYRLHPAAPLALLKFYSRELHMPESLPNGGIYSSTPAQVREMSMFGPQTVYNSQPQAIVYSIKQSLSTRQATSVSKPSQQPLMFRANTTSALSSHPAAALQLMYQRSMHAPARALPSHQQGKHAQYTSNPSLCNSALPLNASTFKIPPSSVGVAGAESLAANQFSHSSSRRLADTRSPPSASIQKPASVSAVVVSCSCEQMSSQARAPQGYSNASVSPFNRLQSQLYPSTEHLPTRDPNWVSPPSLPSRFSRGPR